MQLDDGDDILGAWRADDHPLKRATRGSWTVAKWCDTWSGTIDWNLKEATQDGLRAKVKRFIATRRKAVGGGDVGP